MKYKLHYGDGVLSLPSSVLSRLSDVDAVTLKVLLMVAAGTNLSKEKMAQEIGCDTDAVADALGYWRGAGILVSDTVADKKKSAPAPVPTAPETPAPVVQDSAAAVTPTPATLPRYTTEELVTLLESRRELAALIDECTRILGKVFSTHETSILLGIVDYLNVESEYLLLLLAHCAKMGKKSVRYAEKLAFSLYDEGVTTPDALQECLKQKEELQEAEGKLRTLFGISSRALTTKERKMINTWLFTFHYGLDVVTRAYEITVDAIGKASLPYANSILERWAAEGLHTLDDIQKAEEACADAPKTTAAPGNSFDTDDFFAAALKRSFGDDFELEKKKK